MNETRITLTLWDGRVSPGWTDFGSVFLSGERCLHRFALLGKGRRITVSRYRFRPGRYYQQHPKVPVMDLRRVFPCIASGVLKLHDRSRKRTVEVHCPPHVIVDSERMFPGLWDPGSPKMRGYFVVMNIEAHLYKTLTELASRSQDWNFNEVTH